MREKLIELLKDGGVRDFPFVAALADRIIASSFIEELQNEAYDLGVDSALHDHLGLSWEDAAGLRKEITRLQEATKWIPVTERLPEKEKRVVAYKGYSFLAKIVGNQWFDVEWNCYRYGVTHWMPLPEPPKGE